LTGKVNGTGSAATDPVPGDRLSRVPAKSPNVAGKRIANEDATAVYLDTTPRHLRALRAKRQIPFIRVGEKLVRYDLDVIDKWVDDHGVEAVG
jgi:hypothetical protein